MKTVYIVFSKTNTSTGRFIRIMTGGVYNHTSLAFDSSLRDMYSVARYRYDVPLAGGFVVEHPARYASLSDSRRVRVKICAVSLPDDTYAALRARICRYADDGCDILYNTFGALTSYLGHDLVLPDTYTCVEFVSEAIGAGRVSSIDKLERMLSRNVIYAGRLCYWLELCRRSELINPEYDSDYFVPVKRREVLSETLCHFRRLAMRLVRR